MARLLTQRHGDCSVDNTVSVCQKLILFNVLFLLLLDSLVTRILDVGQLFLQLSNSVALASTSYHIDVL